MFKICIISNSVSVNLSNHGLWVPSLSLGLLTYVSLSFPKPTPLNPHSAILGRITERKIILSNLLWTKYGGCSWFWSFITNSIRSLCLPHPVYSMEEVEIDIRIEGVVSGVVRNKKYEPVEVK